MTLGLKEGIEGGFSSQIEFVINPPSLNEALSMIKVHNPDLTDPKSISLIDSIIDGLNNSSKSIECSKALVDFYEAHPDDRIQMEIMARIAGAEKSSILEDTVEKLLSDENQGSFSRNLDEIDKQHIEELVQVDPGDRPQLLLKQIMKMENQTKDNQTKDNQTKDNQTKDNQTKDNQTAPPPLVDPLLIAEYIRNTYGHRQPSETKPDTNEDPDSNRLKENLNNLIKGNSLDIHELSSQMEKNHDFGRQIGNSMRNNEELRNEITKAVIEIMDQNEENPTLIRNSLSYFHQIGEDTVIPLMSDNQKTNYIPRLMGNNPMDQLVFEGDDLLVRIESGESMTLNSLAQEGPVAIPVLWSIRFGHKIKRENES